jgi:hypothetical protein
MKDRSSPPILRRHGTGYSLEGPGYYVWEEEASEVLRNARELYGGTLAPRSRRRVLVVHPSGEAPPSDDRRS